MAKWDHDDLRSHAPPYKGLKELIDRASIRRFETGATRNNDENQLDFEGFLSPAVLKAFAEYMHRNRRQADGSIRSSDNWQNGIPLDSYMKSLLRHVMDLWMIHRGLPPREDFDAAVGGILFNAMGYWHETLKSQRDKVTHRIVGDRAAVVITDDVGPA